MISIPQQIGKYRISRLLGSGGMGRVYLGTDPDIGREVAIKVVQLDRNAGEASRERFLREAQTMGRLNHPNVVTLLEYGVEGDAPYLVLEFLHGEDLGEWLQRSHPLPHYLKLMQQIAAAIAAAHQAGVLHRDIKPDNIRVIADDRCKLLDFGIADNFDASRLTGTGAFVGTTEFVAPEVVAGQRHSEQSDLYALGLLFYQMLAGCNPFRAEHVSATLARILQLVPVRLSVIRDGIPAPLDALISDCLEKDPAQRPVSASVLVTTLDACLGDLDPNAKLGPIRASATVTSTALFTPSPTAASRQMRRPTPATGWSRYWPVWTLVASTVMLASALAVWWLNQDKDSPDFGAAVPAQVAQPTNDRPGPPPGSTPPTDQGIHASPGDSDEPVVDGSAAAEGADLGAREPDPAQVARGEDSPKPMPQPARQIATPPAPEPLRNSRQPSTERPVATASKDTVVAKPSLPLTAPVQALPPAAGPVGPRQEDTRTAPSGSPAVAQPTAAPSAKSLPAAPVPALEPANSPVIHDASVHLLPRGRPLRLRLSGKNFSAVTAARILIGSRPDPRFRISDLSVANDGELSFRIEVSRNIPLGRYALVVESDAGASPPFLMEVSL